MSIRFMGVCGIVVGSIAFLAMAADQASIRVDAGDDKVTRAAMDAIEKALKSPTECEYTDLPLEKVMEHLEGAHNIEIWIDKQALQDEGITADNQVSLNLSRVTLETALRLMLEPLGLTHLIEDGVMKITTHAKAEECFKTRVYPCGDLIDGDPEALVKVLVTSTSSKWMETDQEGGNIAPFVSANCLVIRQNPRTHREIEGILAALREAKKRMTVRDIPARQG